MKLYFESALRIKIRLLICALIVFAIAWGALYMSKSGNYTTAATVWVETPIYLQSDPSNPYISPATTQANLLGELLGTRQFTLGIAQQAKIPMADTKAEDRVVATIRRTLRVEAVGKYLVRISCTAGKDNYCKDVIAQTTSGFIKELNSNRARQANVALQLYDQQSQTYKEQMVKSRDAYYKYLRDNPDALLASTTTPNPTLADLQQQYTADRTRYDEVVAKIDEIRAQSSAATEANNSFFRVMDPATDATPYEFSMKDLLRNSLVAFVLALFALVAITLVSTWVDPAVYTLNDITPLVLADSESSSELVISVMPYSKALAQIRQRTIRESKAGGKSTHKQSAPTDNRAAPLIEAHETNANRLAESLVDVAARAQRKGVS